MWLPRRHRRRRRRVIPQFSVSNSKYEAKRDERQAKERTQHAKEK